MEVCECVCVGVGSRGEERSRQRKQYVYKPGGTEVPVPSGQESSVWLEDRVSEAGESRGQTLTACGCVKDSDVTLRSVRSREGI